MQSLIFLHICATLISFTWQGEGRCRENGTWVRAILLTLLQGCVYGRPVSACVTQRHQAQKSSRYFSCQAILYHGVIFPKGKGASFPQKGNYSLLSQMPVGLFQTGWWGMPYSNSPKSTNRLLGSRPGLYTKAAIPLSRRLQHTHDPSLYVDVR